MLHIADDGRVLFINEGRTFFLNGGVRARAIEFNQRRLAQGFSDTTTKSFRIPRSFIKELDDTAITEQALNEVKRTGSAAQYTAARAKPLVVDVNRARRQFGLRSSQIEALQKVIVQGTGRIE